MHLQLHIGASKRPDWRMTLAVMFVVQLVSAIGFAIIFPFLPLYIQSLGTHTNMSIEFWAGMVFSSQGFTMMLAGPIWGTLADRHGRKLMVMRAMFGGTVIMLFMAFVTSAEQLVLLRALQGLITGTVAAANALVAGVAPRERMGFAMGTLEVGQWSGVAIGPLIGGVLADMFGYAIPFVVTSVLLLICGILVLVLIKEDFQPLPEVKNKEVGFIAMWRHILSMPGMPMLYVIRFVSGLGRTMIVPFAPLFLVSLLPVGSQHESTYAGLMVAINSGASTITAIYLGRLGDKVGHRIILIGSALACAVFYFPQAGVTDVWQLLILQGLVGAAAGGIIAAPSALLAYYTFPGEEGAVYGLDNSLVSGSRAAAPLAGALVVSVFSVRGTFMATGIMFLIVAYIAARKLPNKPQPIEFTGTLHLQQTSA